MDYLIGLKIFIAILMYIYRNRIMCVCISMSAVPASPDTDSCTKHIKKKDNLFL